MEQKPITRADIAKVLAKIGKPGKKQAEKVAAVKELGLNNFQGVPVEESLLDYPEY